MKKVLITGAAGSIGIETIKNLLKEKKYEITAIDLKCKDNQKYLKKYQNQINIIYGDVTDTILIDALVKSHDYIIHLAGVNPSSCNLSQTFGQEIDYKGTENIARSISFYNPDCLLIYPSTTTLNKKKEKEITVNSKINYDKEDYYSDIKEKCENLIKEKLENYIILRIPFILGDLKKDQSIYLYKKNEEIELITNFDAAYALTHSLELKKELNKKTKIITGGLMCRTNSTELMIYILENYGYSFNILKNKIFKSYLYNGNIYKTDKKIDKLLNYQNDSVESYFMRLKRNTPNRAIIRLISSPLKKRLERSVTK